MSKQRFDSVWDAIEDTPQEAANMKVRALLRVEIQERPMTYEGYTARIEYSDEDQGFVGHIADINDVVGFHGHSVDELRAAFDPSLTVTRTSKDDLGGVPLSRSTS